MSSQSWFVIPWLVKLWARAFCLVATVRIHGEHHAEARPVSRHANSNSPRLRRTSDYAIGLTAHNHLAESGFCTANHFRFRAADWL